MDIDRAGVIRCQSVILPEIIREPRISLTDAHQFAAAFMVNSGGSLASRSKNSFDAVKPFQQCLHCRQVVGRFT